MRTTYRNVFALALILLGVTISPATVASTEDADSEAVWSPIPAEGLVLDASAGGWHLVEVRVPADAVGSIRVESQRVSPSGEGESSPILANGAWGFRPGKPVAYVVGLLFPGEYVRLSVDAAGVVVKEAVDTVDFEVGMLVTLDEELAAWAGQEISFLLVTAEAAGPSEHRVILEDGGRADARILSGNVARAVGIGAFAAAPQGAEVVAKAALVEASVGVDLHHGIRSPCGVTGILIPASPVAPSFDRITFASNGGDTGYLQSTGFAGTASSRALPFGSGADAWDFTIHASAHAPDPDRFALVYAGAWPGVAGATPDEC